MKQFYKAWFSNGTERTAQLVLDTERYPVGTPITEISRLFPYSEAPKMNRFITTSLYDSFEEAFTERPKAFDLLRTK